MIQTIKMPSMGLAIDAVVLTEWLKDLGDFVEKDELIATATSDKVAIEITAPIAGYLVKKCFNESEMVPVGKDVAIINTENEIFKNIEESNSEKFAQEKISAARCAPAEKEVNASPMARKIAQQQNITLMDISGSGPHGMITKEDVLRYLETSKGGEEYKGKATVAADSQGAYENSTLVQDPSEVEVIPFNGIRKVIADNMVKSKHTAPHVTTLVEVDMTETIKLRKKLVKASCIKAISLLALVVKAAVVALKDFPIVNSSIQGENIVIKKYVNMGVAVASKAGLIVPVIRNAHTKNIAVLTEEIKELTEQARKNKVSVEMFKDGTLTISNAGTFGALIATPIINPPQSAIIWTGMITKKPVVVDDKIVIRSMMYLVMSYDHRVLDGFTAAQFLNNMKHHLENPLELLL